MLYFLDNNAIIQKYRDDLDMAADESLYQNWSYVKLQI